MKKITMALVLVTSLICTLLPLHQESVAASSIRVYINNELVQFSNGHALMVNDRVMVPVRGVFEKLGAKVKWSASTETITATLEDQKIERASSGLYANGKYLFRAGRELSNVIWFD